MGVRAVYKIDPEDENLISQYSWYLTSTGYWATRAKQHSPVGYPGELLYITGKGDTCGV